MSFRIAIGSASCNNSILRKNVYYNHVCKGIEARLHTLKNLTPEQLSGLDAGNDGVEKFSGKPVYFTLFKEKVKEGTLFVVQGFVSTFKKPTYFSFKGVGHIVAEGIVVTPKGSVVEPKKEYLWRYR